MLNSLDSRALRAYNQTHYSVGHSYLNRYVTGYRCGWPGWRAQESAKRAFARGAYLREVFCSGKNLALRTGHVLLATSDDEDGFFTAHRRLDIGVRLRSEGFDLAACNQTKKETLIISHEYFRFCSKIKHLTKLSVFHTFSIFKRNSINA